MALTDTFGNLLVGVAKAFTDAIAALATEEGFREVTIALGWSLASRPGPIQSLVPAAEALARATEAVIASSAPTPQDLETLRTSLTKLANGIGNLTSANYPPELVGSSFAREFGRRLVDHSLIEYLFREQRFVLHALRILSVVRFRYIEATTDRESHQEREILWDNIARLLGHPADAYREAFGWGTDAFDGEGFLAAVQDLLCAMGWSAGLEPLPHDLVDAINRQAVGTGAPAIAVTLRLLEQPLPSGETTAGLRLLALSGSPDHLPALAVLPFVSGAVGRKFSVDSHLDVELETTADLQGGLGIRLAPDTGLSLVVGLADPANATVGAGRAAASIDVHDPARTEVTLFETSGGSRFGASTVVGRAGATADSLGSNDFFVELELKDARIEFAAGEHDSFVSSTLPAKSGTSFSLAVGLSTAHGLYLRGGSGLSTRIPVSVALGPILLRALGVTVAPASGGVVVRIDSEIAVNIGPARVVIEGLGLAARVGPGGPGANLGPLDASVEAVPPQGLGLSVEAAGILTGGGFLSHDAALGQYAGVMQLSLQDQLTLKAFGLIATRMPDGSPGYSLLVFITAEDIRPVPLGLGFTLQAIGGMLAVNRTFDQDVLRAGLKNDTLGTLLFPRDPVGNAPALIAALGAAFPARRGSYLLGLLVRIGWMTPTLVQIDLALVLEFGARRRLLALGRISSILPTRDNDLVRLNLDALGVLDFDAGTLAVDAVLVDSRLAQRFPIIGSAALRAGWSANTDFVLTAGGFNPHFVAPVGLPRQERLAIVLAAGDNPRLTCEAYWAITADTYQFGARAHAYAEALGFAVEGDVGFDVLVVPVPLHFIADFHASVQLKRGSYNLFKVGLDGELEGPRPLRLSGKASFEIFWCSFSVRFDTTLLEGEPPPPPPAVDVTAELIKALSTAQSWSTELTEEHTHGVALRRLAPGPALVLDPLGRISVKQQVVPLNTGRDIERFGGAPLAGARRFHVSATLNGQPQDAGPLQAGFAPAQYFEMSDDEKLAAPAFETMDAGLVFGAEQAQFDAAAMVGAPLQYEQILIDAPGQTPQPGAAASTRVPLPVSQLQVQSGAAARTPLRGVGSRRFANTAAPAAARITAVRWSIAALTEGAPPPVAPDVRTWSEYRATLAALNRGGARWQMVPRHELNP